MDLSLELSTLGGPVTAVVELLVTAEDLLVDLADAEVAAVDVVVVDQGSVCVVEPMRGPFTESGGERVKVSRYFCSSLNQDKKKTAPQGRLGLVNVG